MSYNTLKEFFKREFINGKTAFDWAFLGLGLLMQLIAVIFGIATGNPDSLVVIISGFAGILSVVLCAQGKISNYVFSFIQLFTYVFGVAIPYHLWGEVGENIFYFITMIIGIIIWRKNYGKTSKDETVIKSKKLNGKSWIFLLGVLSAATSILGLVLQNTTDPQPWFDSITTTAPLIGQILLTLGYRDQWTFWFIEDALSLIMFIRLGNWIMVAQYSFWTINCIYGWLKWTKTLNSTE